jgi:hypothetical protein
LSHWYYNGRDPLLAVRVLQKIPLQTREEVRNGQFWKLWCERRTAPDPVPCDVNDPDVVRLQYSETFDAWAREFGIGYAQVIRGAVERFGLRPRGIRLQVAAEGPVTREGGGTVSVSEGPLRGARVVVAADAHPSKPERFTIRQHEPFNDPADNMVSSWDDFEAYIGTVHADTRTAREQGEVVSEPVIVGPYRTILNRPASITVPVRATAAGAVERLRPFVFNEVSRSWEPLFEPPGGSAPRFDAVTNSLTFDSQIFGQFLVVAVQPGWTARSAVRNP